jgi:hypothetical protein
MAVTGGIEITGLYGDEGTRKLVMAMDDIEKELRRIANAMERVVDMIEEERDGDDPREKS